VTIPQVKGPVRNIALILIVIPAGYMATAFMGGSLHTWTDFGMAYNTGLKMGLGAAFGWIAMESPWAREVQGMLHQESVTTTTQPSGTIVEQKMETTIVPPVTIEKAPKP